MTVVLVPAAAEAPVACTAPADVTDGGGPAYALVNEADGATETPVAGLAVVGVSSAAGLDSTSGPCAI